MTTAEKALFLARNVHRVALREDAGRFVNDVYRIRDSIEKAINRPVPPLDLGPCPTLNEDQTRCAADLQAKRDDVEITCHKCHVTYNVKDVIEHALDSAKHWLYTEKELLSLMAQIGEHIPRGTWWTWRQRGLIESRNEWGAEPKYFLEDARRLRAERAARKTA